jgi:hypothetical protein
MPLCILRSHALGMPLVHLRFRYALRSVRIAPSAVGLYALSGLNLIVDDTLHCAYTDVIPLREIFMPDRRICEVGIDDLSTQL